MIGFFGFAVRKLQVLNLVVSMLIVSVFGVKVLVLKTERRRMLEGVQIVVFVSTVMTLANDDVFDEDQRRALEFWGNVVNVGCLLENSAVC